jgi:hypothetical protein
VFEDLDLRIGDVDPMVADLPLHAWGPNKTNTCNCTHKCSLTCHNCTHNCTHICTHNCTMTCNTCMCQTQFCTLVAC